MKKNISVIVVFGLLLAFGMLAASCDNGVMPNYTADPSHQDGEYGAKNPLPAAFPIGPAEPAGASPATYTVDFYVGTGTALGGDNTTDQDDDGEDITILKSVGDALVKDGAVMFDPSDGFYKKVSFAVTSGEIKATVGLFAEPPATYP
jgi:hypothetical protein